jgi:ABC-type polysaccharide/polyol phosphate export permease
VLTQLLFFASPIIYPAGFLPGWVLKIAFLNPFVQGMQDVRWLLDPEPEVTTAADVYGSGLGYLVPLASLAVLLLATVALYRHEAPYLAERA